MNRLAALLLLLLTLSPAWAVAGELACVAGVTEIGSAGLTLGDGALAPRATSAKLLYGGPILDLEGSDTPPTDAPAEKAELRKHLPTELRAARIPATESCSPYAQRLPYDATAPPAVR